MYRELRKKKPSPSKKSDGFALCFLRGSGGELVENHLGHWSCASSVSRECACGQKLKGTNALTFKTAAAEIANSEAWEEQGSKILLIAGLTGVRQMQRQLDTWRRHTHHSEEVQVPEGDAGRVRASSAKVRC